MPYRVFFTNENLHPEPLEVFDNTTNVDTSLSFPGRNVVGYGKVIAENFLHLLENFASDTPPNSAKAVVGQIWYNSDVGKIFVFDGVDWKSTSNIRAEVNPPSGSESNIGDLWVNSSTQQLYLWSGTNWILVGPQFSEGTKSGPLVENIFDIDNRRRTVVVFYAEDIPVAIISKDVFVPKVNIQGFTSIGAGINITTRTDISEQVVTPKLFGIAQSAESLVVGNTTVPSANFLRKDEIGTTQFQFNVRDNLGITVGADGNFSLSVANSNAILYNSTAGAGIDIQTNKNGLPNTIVRVVETKVGINNITPSQELDVIGNIQASGSIVSSSIENSTNLNNGSIRTAGGMSVAKDIIVGGSIQFTPTAGALKTRSIEPITSAETIGKDNNRFNTIYAETIKANIIEANLAGDIGGNANTATSLKSATNFKLEGDVQSNVVSFNGTGNLNKVFTTTLTSDIISSKASLGNSRDTDEILVFRSGSGLRKITRRTFFDDSPVPIGAILPYAGTVAPRGYLLCDGSEIEEYRYRELYNVIGTIYNGSVPLKGSPAGTTFRVPDLRGRFVLGKQDMNNNITVPIASNISAGGGALSTAELRVRDTFASILGGISGRDRYVIEPNNIPDHDHDLQSRKANRDPSKQFFVINQSTGVPNDFGPSTSNGGSGASVVRNERATGSTAGQVMFSTGLVRIAAESKRTPGTDDALVGRPFTVMNPFMTLNYIIRSGKPVDQQ